MSSIVRGPQSTPPCPVSARSRSCWAPVWAFAAASSANQMAWLVFAPVATGAASYYHVSTTDIGLLSELFPLIYVLLAMVAGRLVVRDMTAWLVVAASLDLSGALLRLGAVNRHGFAWALGGQILVAAAQPLLLASLTSLARRFLRPEDRPTGIAIGSAGTFAGFILAYTVGGAIGGARSGGVLGADGAYSALTCGAFVWALLRYRRWDDRNEGAQPVPDASPAKVVLPPVNFSGQPVLSLPTMWADPVMRHLGVLIACGFGVFVSLTTWAQTLLAPAHLSTGTVDTFLTAMLTAGALASGLVPAVVARKGRQLDFMVSAGITTIAACLVLALLPRVYDAGICLVAIGALLLPCLPVMLEVTERRYANSSALAANFLWLAGNVGGIVAAVLTGAEVALPWLSFATMAVVTLAAVPSAMKLRGKLAGGDRGVGTAAAVLAEQKTATR